MADAQATGGLDWNLLGSILGQSAQAVAPNEIGGRLGAAGTGLAQSAILDKNRKELMDLIQSLTGQGVDTTQVAKNPDGTLKVTGTVAAPRIEDVNTAPQQIQGTPTLEGGGNQNQSPFYNLLGFSERVA